MTLLKPSEPWAMTAEDAALRRGYAARSELALRNALETFARDRWSDARIVHEVVMGEGRVRADMAAIRPAHIAAFEIKGEYDETTRLLHQVGMYQLCVPEVWMVVPTGKHAEDARLIRHLLPSVGLLVGSGRSARNFYEFDGKDFGLVVEAEPATRGPVPEMTLRLLWASELRAACAALRVSIGPKSTRKNCVNAILSVASTDEIMAAVCVQLRGRDALWRADPPTRTAV